VSKNGAEGEVHGSELGETASYKRIYASGARKRSMIDRAVSLSTRDRMLRGRARRRSSMGAFLMSHRRRPPRRPGENLPPPSRSSGSSRHASGPLTAFLSHLPLPCAEMCRLVIYTVTPVLM
jgi:hypothetical protein